MGLADCLPETVLWALLTGEEKDTASQAHLNTCPQCRSHLQHLERELLQVKKEEAFIPSPLRQPVPDKYHFIRPLGRGGFGEVWLTQDIHLNRHVAVKMLRKDTFQPAGLESLKLEARQLAQLAESRRARRHLVQIYGWEEIAEECFLIMEYVAGGSLADGVKRFGPLHWSHAQRYVADIGETLVEVHSKNIIHRDIKPDNMLWDDDADEALLADFGIAAKVTEARGLCGTVGFMAPELAQGESGKTSDVFALAASLYYLITTKAPFRAKSINESLRAAEVGLPDPDPNLAGIPVGVCQVIRHGLNPQPARRLSLIEFNDGLRGEGIQALSGMFLDTVSAAGRLGAPELKVETWLATPGSEFQPVTFTDAAKPTQGVEIHHVPLLNVPSRSKVKLRFRSASGGFLTLLNLGSSGKATILYPNAQSANSLLGPNEVKEFTLLLTPPAGTDEAVAILSRSPNTLLPETWRQRIQSGRAEIDAYAAYRDMQLLSDELSQVAPSEWKAVGVRIRHD